MAKNKVFIGGAIIIFLILVAMLGVAGFMFLSPVGVIGSGGGTTSEKKTITCDVRVDEKGVFSQLEIGLMNCNFAPGCSFLSGTRLFGIFSEEGTVTLNDNLGQIDSRDYKVGRIINEQQTVTLSGCTRSSEVQIRLLDENGDLIEQKTYGG